MYVKQFCCLLLGLVIFSLGHAFTGHQSNEHFFDGFSVSGGGGRPSSLKGGRLAAQWYWNKAWLASERWHLNGYWDASMAYWRTGGNPDDDHDHKSLATVAFSPIFRWERGSALFGRIHPYFEASWGLALLSDQHLSYRNQGAHWTFQDLVGCGFQFGQHGEYDLSYHYLHYSNAGINPPNNGIDVKTLISLHYRFS